MASMNPKERRDAFADSMIAEGLLDQQFNQLLMLEEDGGGFLVEVIKLFCDDSERMISELSSLIDQPVVDFQKVGSFVHQLKGSSSRISNNMKVLMAAIVLLPKSAKQKRNLVKGNPSDRFQMVAWGPNFLRTSSRSI